MRSINISIYIRYISIYISQIHLKLLDGEYKHILHLTEAYVKEKQNETSQI